MSYCVRQLPGPVAKLRKKTWFLFFIQHIAMPGRNPNRNGKRAMRGRKRNGAIVRSTGLTGTNLLAPAAVPVPRPVGIPATSNTTHRYCEMGLLNGTSGALGVYTWKANSLFDPDSTGGGHQPYGFDQFKAYYATYQVMASRMYVECITAVAATLAGVITSTEATPGSTLTAANLLMEPGRGQGGLVNVGAPTRAFEARWDLKQLYPDHDPGDFQAAVGADPSNVDYYTIFHQEPNLTASPVLYYTVVIEYHCIWKNPVTLASS